MTHLVCLLEEPSAECMLQAVLPRILPANVKIHCMVFQGKQDLEKHLEKRIRGWMQPDSLFLVMRDQDSGDCITIKKGLQRKIHASGKEPTSLIRIACHELESFYLGDLEAVGAALGLVHLSKQQDKAKYRTPDKLPNASQELRKLTEDKYQKISGSRAIAPLLKLDGSNRSHSFNCLLAGVRRMTER